MANCTNCNKALSCGCQRRTASNGTPVCSTCLTAYEASLKNKTAGKPVAVNIIHQKK